MSETVEWAIFGTSARSAAILARLRVDQWGMCSPRPSGSQHASISMPTRCRGGKGPGSTIPGSVVDDLYPVLFIPTAEVPDRRSIHLETVGQLSHDGRWIGHGQQDPRSP